MRRSRVSALILNAMLALPLVIPPAAAVEPGAAAVTVSNAWLRATPGGATVGAAFLEIKTAPDVADALLSASSPAAGRVEIHTHIKDGDVMKMRRVERLQLEAGKAHILRPGGDHVMLFDLKQPLREGDTVKLTLTFEKAGAIDVEGQVAAPGAMAPPGAGSPPPASDGAAGGADHHSGHGQGHEGH